MLTKLQEIAFYGGSWNNRLDLSSTACHWNWKSARRQVPDRSETAVLFHPWRLLGPRDHPRFSEINAISGSVPSRTGTPTVPTPLVTNAVHRPSV